MEIFDTWVDRYEKWFDRPLGRAVLGAEQNLVASLLKPSAGQRVLDLGCGTGIFTRPVADSGARVTALDLSYPMVRGARSRLGGKSVHLVNGHMRMLPFADGAFDHVFSITALEFIPDARQALDECLRVVKTGGTVVVATLNRYGFWAARRRREAAEGHSVFREAVFRSCGDLLRLMPNLPAECATAVHFPPSEHPFLVKAAPMIEAAGRRLRLKTGAFAVVKWTKV